MQPSICRLVHYYRIDDKEVKNPHAAIIIKVLADGTTAALQVFAPFGKITHEPAIKFSEIPAPGSWTWPPRVEYSGGVPQA